MTRIGGYQPKSGDGVPTNPPHAGSSGRPFPLPFDLKYKPARNSEAWAIGAQARNGFKVRRVVWGLLMAQAERRDGEQIRAAVILVEREHRKRRSVLNG